MSDTFKKLETYSDKLHAYRSASTLFNWDNSTYGAPKAAINNTAKDIGILSGEVFSLMSSPELKSIIKELIGDDTLTESQRAIVMEYKKSIDNIEKIPMEEYVEYSTLIAQAYPVWEEAKLKNNFDSYAPVLEKIIAFTKKFAEYTKKDGHTLYESALDDYEEGFREDMLEEFFGKLKSKIQPVVRKMAQREDKEPEFMTYKVDVDTQRKLSHYLAEYIGFDFERGVLAETEHPFTTSLHNHDVRITTHYYENHWPFAVFSTIHEGGHALYEQGIGDDITLSIIGGGTSLGMHESQSRLYENNIGRSRAFWQPIYSKLANEYLPFLKDIDLEEFYKGINYAYPTLIRTEADELTYPFHIMIRYEIEKMMFEGDLPVKDLPEIWNRKYKEYLGIEPKDHTTGILQDMHWSGGSIGYFPTYAIGSAIAAQLYAHMDKAINIEELLLKGDLITVRKYLNEHIHRYGGIKNTDELLRDICNEGFNPDYYIDYLLNKFDK